MQATATRERPMHFSGAMVRAILDGHKTQTRRIAKPQPTRIGPGRYRLSGSHWSETWRPDCELGPGAERIPFGCYGDCLRISEAVTVQAVADDRYSLLFDSDLSYTERYGDAALIAKIRNYKKGCLRGVHLPPAFARSVRLRIVRVRLEPLWDISEFDAIAEGCSDAPNPDFDPDDPMDDLPYTFRAGFARLWSSIYGQASWDSNPFVWVVEFTVDRT